MKPPPAASHLESTRSGRICQAFGACWIGLGTGLAIFDQTQQVPLWVQLINAVTITSGLWCLLGPGRWMVRNAREHKVFMDGARKRVADLDREYDQVTNRRWN